MMVVNTMLEMTYGRHMPSPRFLELVNAEVIETAGEGCLFMHISGLLAPPMWCYRLQRLDAAFWMALRSTMFSICLTGLTLCILVLQVNTYCAYEFCK